MPVANSSSREGYVEIMKNEDESRCPDECFRPVGLEWSSGGEQMFMAADASGEIYVVYRSDGSSVNDFTVSATPTTNGTDGEGSDMPSQSGGASATPSGENAAGSLGGSLAGAQWWVGAAVAVVVAYFS